MPEASLGEHGIERAMCLIDRAIEGLEEPDQPRRDIQRTLLCSFQNVVVQAIKIQ